MFPGKKNVGSTLRLPQFEASNYYKVGIHLLSFAPFKSTRIPARHCALQTGSCQTRARSKHSTITTLVFQTWFAISKQLIK